MPNSAGTTLICRRSVALIVPSWTGTSYFLPVRLSVIVSVSGMGCRHHARVARSLALARLVGIRLLRQVFARYGIAARQPPSQVGHLATLAAERPPRRVHRFLPAVDAPRVEGGQTLSFYLEISCS